MATIRDVARIAGVSIATVSHVMNGTRPVADSTRQRVFAAMKELHFQPSAFARGMRLRSFKTIGLIMGDFSDPFYAQIFQGLERVASQFGYSVMVANTNEDATIEFQAIQLMIQKGLNGLVVAPCPNDKDARDLVETLDFPTVLIDRLWDGSSLSSVVLDNHHAAELLVDHLFNRGHRDILFVAGRIGLSTTSERLEGYIQSMEKRNLKPLIVNGGSVVEGGREAAKWWLTNLPHTTAIICGNNLMMTGLLEVLEAHGAFPGNVTVVGVDNEAWTGLMIPPITVIDQPAASMGEEAARLLIDRIERGVTETKKAVFPGRLVCRD